MLSTTPGMCEYMIRSFEVMNIEHFSFLESIEHEFIKAMKIQAGN